MIIKKQYIPKRYRSKKLVNAGGGVAVGGSLTSSTSGSSVDMSAFLLADKFTSLFEYDEVNDAIKAKLPFYSEGEISAYGFGGSGGGGGTGIVYNGLDSTITDIALSAYMGNVLNTNKLEVSAFNSWVSNYVPPVPSWGDVTGKPSTFPATAHVHGWGEIENKPTTFAPSAHTHTWDSITSKPNAITGTTASFTTELETKLTGIAEGANNYTHPASHAIGFITGLETALSGKLSLTGGTLATNTLDIKGAGTDIDDSWINFTDESSVVCKLGIRRPYASYGFSYFDGTNYYRVYHEGNFNPANYLPLLGGTMTGNLTMGVATDIITNFKTWTKDSSKSLKSFLDKFDIDANGNLVVIGNLYSTGEVTANSSGTGVSGLKLMGDLDANGKNINNVNYISNSGSKISLSEPDYITFSIFNNEQFVIAEDGIFASGGIEASYFYASAGVYAPEFKFGNWTFKQDASGRLGIYNGTTEVACFNTDGTYVNL